jgi:uncharacterized membrane protein
MALGSAGLDAVRDAGAVETDRIKGAAGASENYGNFYGQNLFFGAAGVALTVATLGEHGVSVDPRQVSRWTVPIAVASVLVGVVQYWFLDRSLRSRHGERGRPRS